MSAGIIPIICRISTCVDPWHQTKSVVKPRNEYSIILVFGCDIPHAARINEVTISDFVLYHCRTVPKCVIREPPNTVRRSSCANESIFHVISVGGCTRRISATCQISISIICKCFCSHLRIFIDNIDKITVARCCLVYYYSIAHRVISISGTAAQWICYAGQLVKIVISIRCDARVSRHGCSITFGIVHIVEKGFNCSVSGGIRNRRNVTAFIISVRSVSSVAFHFTA